MADQVGLREARDLRDLNEYPEDVKEEYLFLSNWIKELSKKYGEKLLIRVIDVQSVQGLLKSIRYGIHRYPSFIINKKEKYTGMDKEKLEALLQSHLGEL